MSLLTAASVRPPAEIGVYIHWPYCSRVCPYCDFAVVRDRGRAEEQADLVEAIGRDLRAQAALLGPRRLASIFFGGGTPSLMAPEAVGELIALCRSLWPGEDQVEVSLEANPTDAEAGRFAALAASGVGRLSLGVQALDDASLAFLGRNHGAEEAVRAVRLAAAAFSRVSIDLIYALPGQSEVGWAQSLKWAVGLGCEHLSAYELTIEAGTPFDRAVRRGRFQPADPERAAAFYEITQTTLYGEGFCAYEISNHARGSAARCRHNLIYWRGGEYVGVGPSAHGRLRTPLGRAATATPPAPRAYIERVRAEGNGLSVVEPLSLRAVAEERLIMGLRTDEGVAREELAALPLGRLPELIDAGLVIAADGRLTASPAGRLVLNRISLLLAEG